jgi:hypothetical protein
VKKLIAALMLSIYLFNIAGQLAVHQYFSYVANKFFNEQSSKGLYNTGDLTEVEIPVNMPNIADWKDYENIAGQIQFGDASYNYVKMRITRHTLYLMCVPNYDATRLLNQNIIGAKQVKHTPVPKKDHVPYSKTTLSGKSDFAFYQFTFHSFYKTIQMSDAQPAQRLACHHLSIPDQPPRRIC